MLGVVVENKASYFCACENQLALEDTPFYFSYLIFFHPNVKPVVCHSKNPHLTFSDTTVAGYFDVEINFFHLSTSPGVNDCQVCPDHYDKC